ncbi:MAG: DUF6151 family protein [Myxococcota bacterium]
MQHPLACRCGKVKGSVEISSYVNRGLCYCRDCRAFLRALGREDVLDAHGGTDIVQTLPPLVRFSQGQEQLACLRLTDKGLMRWYAQCCNTPIGNTLENPKFPFVGLPTPCLSTTSTSLEESFGPATMRVWTKSALGTNKPSEKGFFLASLKLMRMIVVGRLSNSHLRPPFFDAQSGKPVVSPRILSAEELAKYRPAHES